MSKTTTQRPSTTVHVRCRDSAGRHPSHEERVQIGMELHERSRGPSVVRMDVRQEQVRDVSQLEAEGFDSAQESLDRRARPTVDEGGLAFVDEIDPDDLGDSAVLHVDEMRHAHIIAQQPARPRPRVGTPASVAS